MAPSPYLEECGGAEDLHGGGLLLEEQLCVLVEAAVAAQRVLPHKRLRALVTLVLLAAVGRLDGRVALAVCGGGQVHGYSPLARSPR